MTVLKFELVSPERLLVSREVGMVTVPGEEGEFGVLPGHVPLVSSLRMGVLKIHDNGELAESYFVTGGFAEVSAERCIVVAEEAQPVAEIKRAEVEALLGRLGTALSASTDQTETSRLNQEIEVAKAKLALAA